MVNTRELILGILLEVMEEGNYSHLVIRSVLDKYQYLEKQERAFITRVAEGTIQTAIELDYVINQYSKIKAKKMKPVIRNLLRMSVYQIKYMDAIPDSAVCNEAVKLAKKRGFSSLSGFVNGVLRNISRNPQTQLPDKERFPVEYYSIKYSTPEWIVEKWLRDYGISVLEETLEAFSQEAPITVRTNLEKITPDALEKRFLAEGVKAEKIQVAECPGLDYAFAISGFDYLNALPCFTEGLFYVQDISSMMVAECAAPKEGDYIIDVCAAPGGKSTHLAEKLHGSGMVEARDLTEYKVGLIEENRKRHACTNMKAIQMDATVFDEASSGKADIVIADLPCSGLGVLRKKTDIKYKMTPEKAASLANLQKNMLDTVCGYVKDHGTLIYSTCTINRMENEENVAWFLNRHPEFKLEEMKQIFPKKDFGDGFFIAKFNKSGEQ